jgi:hypothetical protein
MLGQYWDSGIPSQLYSMKYFGFKRQIVRLIRDIEQGFEV